MFAAGSLTNRLTIEVAWRSGRRSVVPEAAPDAIYEIDEAAATEITDHGPLANPLSALRHPQSPDLQPSTPNAQPFFVDVSERLGHTHHEEPFDDFSPAIPAPPHVEPVGTGCELGGLGCPPTSSDVGSSTLDVGRLGVKADPRTSKVQPATLNQLTGWWNGLTTVDLDGDGRLDIVAANWGLNTRYRATPEHPLRLCYGDYLGNGTLGLIQSCFDPEPMTRRDDAGRGLWLRGDGRGGLKAVPVQESAIQVYGEQCGAALCDFDGDDRVDLVVSQNGIQTKLYRNVGARPGLRVRLKGPPGNPTGVGATVRLKFGERFGPAREIHAGSGYWSQDSPVLVFGTPAPPTEIWVRWPGGRVTTSPVPANAKEVTVTGSPTPTTRRPSRIWIASRCCPSGSAIWALACPGLTWTATVCRN